MSRESTQKLLLIWHECQKEKIMFDEKFVLTLAHLVVDNYKAQCDHPTIRGLNGEKSLRGDSLEEVSKNTGLSVEEVQKRTVDLAQASFDDLPPYWQNVNIDSARSLISMFEPIGNGDAQKGAEKVRHIVKLFQELASEVHSLWLQNNQWAIGTELEDPFDKLHPSQQMKDILVLFALEKALLAQENKS